LRTSWTDYFLDLAAQAATRSTCPRKHVGCVLVRNRIVVSIGYNGSVRKLDHCDDVGCMMEDNHCVRVNHAEINALVHAARYGYAVDGTTAYITASPCWNCFRALANAGINRIVYREFYKDDRIFSAAATLKIPLEHFPGSKPA
jgi:dCMP deaminase